MGVPPIGYIRLASGEWAIDPDEQVQATVRLIFDQFGGSLSLHELLCCLVHHRVLIPAAGCWSGGGRTGRLCRICCMSYGGPDRTVEQGR
ncbi:hypothetical protein [Singulisphaera acidiphila]|uniref:hypothetical protein n=1 Tax=Singulisphaera acidiphila TaxID=466153 RepID=UPI00024708B2|nr:hypothetical protein [Singulisphaera acidiphila]